MFSGTVTTVPPRTQRERSDSTRSALIDAALALLDERGWAATTSVAVVERAGLTRGALVHHFGDLPSLLAEALDAHYAGWADQVTEGPATRDLASLVESMWHVIATGRMKIVIEAWLAATNDAELGRSIGPVIARFAKLVDPTGADVVRSEADRLFVLTARETMLGLALGRATTGGPLPHEDAVVGRLVALARAHDSGDLP